MHKPVAERKKPAEMVVGDFVWEVVTRPSKIDKHYWKLLSFIKSM